MYKKSKKMSNHYYGDSMNWSTYPPMKKAMKKNGYWAPTPLLFINPEIVCSRPKAKVC